MDAPPRLDVRMTVVPSEVRTRQFRGATFRYGVFDVESIGNSSYYTHEVAELHIRERYWHPGPGQVVADVGGAFGSYALPAAALGARVFTFEPVPAFAECLRVNAGLNGWGEDRMRVLNYALGNAESDYDYPPKGHPDVHRYRFHQRRLDDVVEELGLEHLEWLKSDTEGHEAEVLQGARETLRSFRPTLLLEVHKFLDQAGESTQQQRILDELLPMNYTWEIYIDSPVDYIFATPRR